MKLIIKLLAYMPHWCNEHHEIERAVKIGQLVAKIVSKFKGL